MPGPRIHRWKARVAAIKVETYALYLASRDPRVPLRAKVVAALVVAYLLSPIDLIPDFIPFVGHLDDFLLVPLGLALAVRWIPPEVMAEHRAAATRPHPHPRLVAWSGAAIVSTLWLVGLAVFAVTVRRLLRA